MSESSWLIFHQKSKFRKFLTGILGTKFWDRFTLVLIFVNGIMLAVDNPVQQKSAIMSEITKGLNKTFTIIFLIEMACKIISMGFLFNSVNNDRAYIRSYWNFIDFIVVLFSGVDLVSTNSTFKSFKILRCFRALRPLKVINKNE